jgi:hypothetical protein
MKSPKQKISLSGPISTIVETPLYDEADRMDRRKLLMINTILATWQRSDATEGWAVDRPHLPTT